MSERTSGAHTSSSLDSTHHRSDGYWEILGHRTARAASYHFQADDEMMDGRKVYKNPRNAPSENCPRDEDAALRMVITSSILFFIISIILLFSLWTSAHLSNS